jgi:hypothetical protein
MSSMLDTKIPLKFSSDETFEMFLDQECTYLAEGTSRKVYSVRGDKYVVKVATLEHATCNWIEIAAFLNFEDDRSRLARIDSWSLSGRFIVMERLTFPASLADQFVYPAWVTDRKSSNIGKSQDGTCKICDYAYFKSPDCMYSPEFT